MNTDPLILWHSKSLSRLHRLYKIQNNFLRFLSFKCHVERIPHSECTGVEGFFNLSKFKVDFNNNELQYSYLNYLKTHLIDCPKLLERINFKINII